MGTDIHLQVERQNDNGVWERVLPPRCMDAWHREHLIENPNDAWTIRAAKYNWYNDRNYSLFGMLADVRNGRGFAGALLGDGFIPISEPRGLPDDLSAELDQKNFDHDDECAFWLGDHSWSWLTVKELLDYNWNQTTKECCLVPYSYFLKWRKSAPAEPDPKECDEPFGFAADISGKDIVKCDMADLDSNLLYRGVKPTHVRVWWNNTYADCAGNFYTEVLPELTKLGAPDRVRIVFGFDS